jgi:hypothetical protein
VTYEQAQESLLRIARQNGGMITARDVEADATLAADQDVVCAAARALSGSTNVFTVPNEGEGWFPYVEIRITDLH